MLKYFCSLSFVENTFETGQGHRQKDFREAQQYRFVENFAGQSEILCQTFCIQKLGLKHWMIAFTMLKEGQDLFFKDPFFEDRFGTFDIYCT